jgi:tetratricopeptide (TPR) repeat protein
MDPSLDELLDRLPPVPFAEALLVGTWLYRMPMPPEALAWLIGWTPELPRNPEPDPMPEVAWPERSDQGSQLLVELGFLIPVDGDDGSRRWQAHEEAGARLAEMLEDEAVAGTHRRAALYWRWKAEKVPQSREQDMLDFFEARHHHRHAGELEEALKVTHWICAQLDLWGDYDQEEKLLREALGWLPEGSETSAALLGQLGNLAMNRGQLDQALEHYQASLAIHQQQDDLAGIAGDYHQIGMVIGEKGDFETAAEWYREALGLQERAGNRAGVGRAHHQLAMIAQENGDFDQAREGYSRALAIQEELGDRAAMATSYHQLGTLAQLEGNFDQALDLFRRSYAILEERQDRANMAMSLSQQGILHTERGAPAEAIDPTLHSLAIRLQLELPVDTNMYWLAKQREMLGGGPFHELLSRHLDDESRDSLLERL